MTMSPRPHPRRAMAGLLLATSVAACTTPAADDPLRPAPGASDAVAISAEGQRLGGITVETVVETTVADALDAVGTVDLDESRTARIGALAEGIVSATHASVGDRVRRGALLAGLHSHEVHDAWGDYRKALADRRRAAQEVEYADTSVARAERLLADKAASAREVERARADKVAAGEQLVMATAEVRRAQESLEHLGLAIGDGAQGQADEIIPVRTPIAGVVLERLVTAGTTVTPGVPMFVVSDLGTLWVQAAVDETALGTLRVGAVVRLTVAAFPGETFTGRVAHVADRIDSTTRRVRVRCVVENGDGRLKPGMFARVAIVGATPPPSVHVPAEAVQTIDDRRVVFVPVADGRYVPRDVDTGRERDGRIEIRRGLVAGDRVVVRGAFLLKSQLLSAADEES